MSNYIVEEGVRQGFEARGIEYTKKTDFALGFIPTGSHYEIAIPAGREQQVQDTLEMLGKDPKHAGYFELAGMRVEDGHLKFGEKSGGLSAASFFVDNYFSVDLSKDPEKAIALAAAKDFGGLGAKHGAEFGAIDKNRNGKIEFSDLDRNGNGQIDASDGQALSEVLSSKAFEVLSNNLAKQGVKFSPDATMPGNTVSPASSPETTLVQGLVSR